MRSLTAMLMAVLLAACGSDVPGAAPGSAITTTRPVAQPVRLMAALPDYKVNFPKRLSPGIGLEEELGIFLSLTGNATTPAGGRPARELMVIAKGEGVSIIPVFDARQPLVPAGETRWIWRINPSREGAAWVELSILLYEDAKPEPTTLDTLRYDFSVERGLVSLGGAVRHFGAGVQIAFGLGREQVACVLDPAMRSLSVEEVDLVGRFLMDEGGAAAELATLGPAKAAQLQDKVDAVMKSCGVTGLGAYLTR